jgi:methyl-accepting chemotaxis protein
MLGIKIALWVSLALIVVFVLITVTNFSYQKALIEKQERDAATTLASTILGAIRYPMLEGEQEVIQEQLNLIKKENPDIVVHLLDDEGVIRRSTESNLIGEKSKAKGLLTALEGTEIKGVEFRRRTGLRVYEELKPILNERACFACHGSAKKVLGVLRIAKDFRPAELAIISARNRNIIISLVGFLIATFLIIFLSRAMLAPLSAFVPLSKSIAQGDLTKEINIKTKDEIGMVAEAFNTIVISLRKMVGNILTVAENVMNSAQQFSFITQQMSDVIQQINSAMNQITSGVTTQTQKVEDVSKIMGSVISSLKDVESKAKDTAGGSSFASSQVNLGGERMLGLSEKMDKVFETVKRNVELMRVLEERSQQIGEITEAITSIADQTNLLSLNAAIEAARAGEAGRGFGVVADEIRKLAEDSAQAANRIGGLIRSIQDEVGKAITSIESGSRQVTEGREVVIEVREVLKKTISAVDGANTMAQEIVKAIGEQLLSTEKVVKAVDEVASIAEETSSSVEETTSSVEEQTASMEEIATSAQELTRLAQEMKELVGKFKIG